MVRGLGVAAAAAGRKPGPAVGRPALVAGYVALLALLAAGLTVAVGSPGTAPGDHAVLALPAFALLLAAAEWLLVRFRVGRDVNALNLVEAVLAPLLFAFPITEVVLTVAAGQVLAGAGRRNSPLKAAFNIAQWSLAAACGAAVVAGIGGDGVTPRTIGGLLLALLAVGVVNNLAFAIVLALSTGSRRVLRGLRPTLWLEGLAANAALGLLFVLAYAAVPAAVALFVVPLGLLHLAYRGQALARAERGHVNGLHRAARALTGPIDPRDGIPAFLHEVALTLDARLVLLVLRGDAGREVHRLERDEHGELPETATVSLEPDDAATLAGALAALPSAITVERSGDHPLAGALHGEGGQELLGAPMRDDDRLLGALVVLDPAGLEWDRSAQLTVVEALAREATSAFTKGRLLARVIDERRKLDLVVSTTSDGMLALDADGVVQSWNPAMERITGLPADAVVGLPGALSRVHMRTVRGVRVDLTDWCSNLGELPSELRLAGLDGTRRLSCSYSTSYDGEGRPESLVVIARDVTPVEQIEELRAQFDRLVQAEAAQRLVVEHLQQAVMPPWPAVAGAELGVAYVASDPSSPTGGDLYDCQVLPDGDLHLAVVDVLGHGTHATQDALTVMHTLRTVVLDGTPLDQVVARADALLGRQQRDLVATVVLARYTPADGRLQVVSGGHPPPLVVTAGRDVRELEPGGCAIGWPAAGSDGVVEERLEPGDALVLYTDGLIEARKDVVEGLAALGRHARDVAHLPADALADALVRRALGGAERRDDTLALVLRRSPIPAPHPRGPGEPLTATGAEAV